MVWLRFPVSKKMKRESESKRSEGIMGHTLRFLWLLFWEYPFRREPNVRTRDVTSYYYIATTVMMIVGLFGGSPYVSPDEYPLLAQATVVEGRLIRHVTQHGGKYTSEPLGVETSAGPVFKRCSTLGIECLDRSQWVSFEGKPARLWYWRDWAIQLEVDGMVPDRMSYERQRRFLTRDRWSLIGVLVGVPFLLGLIRVTRRYGKAVWREAFEVRTNDKQATTGEMK